MTIEIAPVPHRRPLGPAGRLLVLVAVLAPVTLFALLPIVLGFQRYVVSSDSMAPTLTRGTLLLERRVPASDLGPGDIITFRPPPPYDSELVTHRIVAVSDGTAVTRGDAMDAVDPWRVDLSRADPTRLEVRVPLIGHAYLAFADRRVLAGVALLPALVVVAWSLVGGRRRRPAVREDPSESHGSPQHQEVS